MIREGDLAVHDAEHRRSSEGEWLAVDDEPLPLAAHVVTSRRGYTHHGIYVGDGTVVHYAGLSRGWRPGPVEEISLAEFARGRPVQVRPSINIRFDRSDVVARARSRLGEREYRVLSNNCEHFCEWCECGESRSRQIELWRTGPWRILLAAVRFLERYAGLPAPLLDSARSRLRAMSLETSGLPSTSTAPTASARAASGAAA